MIDKIGIKFGANDDRTHAAEYYLKGHSFDKLIECYFLMEDFQSLENISVSVEDTTALKVTIE
jgi:hypothetical protein